MTTKFTFLTLCLCSVYCEVLATSRVFFFEPQDVCAVVGQEAFFPCVYNGTSTHSMSWKINGRIRSTARLPSNHRQNGTGLVVTVHTSYNQSTYSCIIRILSVDGETVKFESKIAVLTVVAQMASLACLTLKPTPTLRLTVISSLTISSYKFSSVTSSFIVMPQPVSSILPTTSATAQATRTNVQIIFIGISSTTVVSLLLALTLVTVILLVKHANTHNKQNEHNEPIYEEIRTLNESKEGRFECTNLAAIELERNCSYGDIKTFKLTESPAYCQIENCPHQASTTVCSPVVSE